LRIPIYELADKMPYEELLGWFSYFEQRPAGWRDDDRTHKLLQAQGVKEKPWIIFPTLSSIYKPSKATADGININNLKTSGLFQKLLSAKGGDKVSI